MNQSNVYHNNNKQSPDLKNVLFLKSVFKLKLYVRHALDVFIHG